MAVPRICSKLIDKYQSWTRRKAGHSRPRKANSFGRSPGLCYTISVEGTHCTRRARDNLGISKHTPPHSALHSSKHGSAQASSFPPPKKTQPPKPALRLILCSCLQGTQWKRQRDFRAWKSLGHTPPCTASFCNSQCLTPFETSGERQQQ